MKKLSVAVLLFAGVLCVSAQDNLSALLPMPNTIEQTNDGSFLIEQGVVMTTNSPSLDFAASQMEKIISKRMGVGIQKGNKVGKRTPAIKLLIDKSIKGDDRYTLSVTKKGISIRGGSPGGVYYGVMTFDQLLLGDVCSTNNKEVASVYIDDEPRFHYRSMMLDPARHFLPVEDVKFFIDLMSRYKYNVLQMHLTDDQGWRVEIKSHPELIEKGAFRNPKGGKNGPDNGFYTQKQLKDIIEYAALRNVEVVPEIDIPGHTVAVLVAHPEFGCTTTDSVSKVLGKTTNMMLCASNEKVFDLYKDVIAELSEVFPSKYIHLGGDESVLEDNWAKCDYCTQLMQKLNYTGASQLMNYFFGRILPFVREKNKQAVLWLELDNPWMPANEYLFDYPDDVVLVTWRNGLTPLCLDLTYKHNNPIIMAPGEYAYLDYPQRKGDLPEFNNWGMPVSGLRNCYKFDPGYNRPDKEQAHIMGINVTMWGEAIKTIDRATYMAYPRALALVEAGWTEMENRSWESFIGRLYPNLVNMIKDNVWVSTPFEPEPRNK